MQRRAGRQPTRMRPPSSARSRRCRGGAVRRVEAVARRHPARRLRPAAPPLGVTAVSEEPVSAEVASPLLVAATATPGTRPAGAPRTKLETKARAASSTSSGPRRAASPPLAHRATWSSVQREPAPQLPAAEAAAGVLHATARGWWRRCCERADTHAVSFSALGAELGAPAAPALGASGALAALERAFVAASALGAGWRSAAGVSARP